MTPSARWVQHVGDAVHEAWADAVPDGALELWLTTGGVEVERSYRAAGARRLPWVAALDPDPASPRAQRAILRVLAQARDHSERRSALSLMPIEHAPATTVLVPPSLRTADPRSNAVLTALVALRIGAPGDGASPATRLALPAALDVAKALEADDEDRDAWGSFVRLRTDLDDVAILRAWAAAHVARTGDAARAHALFTRAWEHLPRFAFPSGAAFGLFAAVASADRLDVVATDALFEENGVALAGLAARRRCSDVDHLLRGTTGTIDPMRAAAAVLALPRDEAPAAWRAALAMDDGMLAEWVDEGLVSVGDGQRFRIARAWLAGSRTDDVLAPMMVEAHGAATALHTRITRAIEGAPMAPHVDADGARLVREAERNVKRLDDKTKNPRHVARRALLSITRLGDAALFADAERLLARVVEHVGALDDVDYRAGALAAVPGRSLEAAAVVDVSSAELPSVAVALARDGHGDECRATLARFFREEARPDGASMAACASAIAAVDPGARPALRAALDAALARVPGGDDDAARVWLAKPLPQTAPPRSRSRDDPMAARDDGDDGDDGGDDAL